jgi:large subunit ribosomal protein L22
MEYQATAKYIRTGVRKMRLIADLVRGLSPDDALIQLAHMSRFAAAPMEKVLRAAIVNAQSKQTKRVPLQIKNIEVMGGPVMKRWHAASRGQAHPYKKRMTHIRIKLTDEKEEKIKNPTNNQINKYGSKN